MAPVGYSQVAQFWADTVGSGRDRYRVELTDDAVLAQLGRLDGCDVLDAGCGEGYLARTMAGNGATVIGIDLDSDLIDIAQRHPAAPTDGRFEVGSLYSLPLADASVDRVVLNHVVNDLEHLDVAIAEVARVLRTGGRVVALMLHPCFYWADRGRPEDWPSSYWSTAPKQHGFSVDGVDSPGEVLAWYRPLQDVVASFGAAGLSITSMTEPHPTDEQLMDPWWSERWSRPLFLIIEGSIGAPIDSPGDASEGSVPTCGRGSNSAGPLQGHKPL
ncbi:MAG: class I SAM-dependent methyltransferase [Actinomycetota bacterium]